MRCSSAVHCLNRDFYQNDVVSRPPASEAERLPICLLKGYDGMASRLGVAELEL